MNWKVVAALIILAVAGVAGWKTHLYMDARAIAVLGSSWVIQREGWAILWELWPATLLITLVGGITGSAAILTIYGYAALADENERVKQAEQAQAEAERERDKAFASEQQAHEIARRNLDRERATVEQFRQQLLEQRDKFMAWEAKLQEREALAETEVARAQESEARVSWKQHNATQAYKRKDRKIEKLETRIAELELQLTTVDKTKAPRITPDGQP